MTNGIPHFPGVRVVPAEYQRYLVETIELVITSGEVYAHSEDEAHSHVAEGRVTNRVVLFERSTYGISPHPDDADDKETEHDETRDSGAGSGDERSEYYDSGGPRWTPTNPEA